MLSGQQNKRFRPLAQKAWRVSCAHSGCDPKDRKAFDKWYRVELVSGLGIYTTKEIHDVIGFDALCLHFAILSGDTGEIAYWSQAEERRALWRLKGTMKNAGVDWPYARGIARNMGYDKEIEDLPAKLILKINTAVYLHLKRKQKGGQTSEPSRQSGAPGEPASTDCPPF